MLRRREGRDIWQGLYEFPMIETPAPADLPDLSDDSLFVALLGPAPWRLLRTVALPVHQLSHQRIHARLYRIEAPELTPEAAALAIPTSELGDHALPRLLDRYLASSEAI